MFETWVLEDRFRHAEHVARIFSQLFPVQEQRGLLIKNACGVSDTGEGDDRQDLNQGTHYELEDLIKYSTIKCKDLQAGERDAVEVRRKQIEAWRQVPWTTVLAQACPLFMDRLGNYRSIEDTPFSEQIAVIDQSILCATESRCLLLTQDGRPGLGPPNMKSGDRLCVLMSGSSYAAHATVSISDRTLRSVIGFGPACGQRGVLALYPSAVLRICRL
ncbi:hypothetical protein BU23DRAFT_597730 [Bimuria novae-zelandiae CBS 107.79]|uniref:Uncharacterized protein n=1 Tax=Bimuria novae-zelandiae CBS 107.79 TaxID=1447943 RepID=A0A6A5VFT3_9PLEO|nr:hypothetical protein BU23DRAFT_597730 [Bimuria novae-zelandiae CBS 107.79]